MVELPPHVFRVTARGRFYYYFQVSRGSKTPGPRIPLPSDPHDVAFWQAYKAAAGADAPMHHTVDSLIAAYKMSPEFVRLAETTKKDDARYLAIVSASWGPLLVSGLRPKNVINLRDAWASTPVAANHLLAITKTLINWGIPREFSDTNPCTAIPRLRTDDGGGARPWPVWAYELIETHAREDLRRAVWLARYTGQRQSDVIRMSKADLDDGGIEVKQQKTGKELWIPLHQHLKDEMERWEVLPPWIFVQTPKGEGYDPVRFRAAWTRLMETPAGRIRREGLTFHGLRASSVEKLREAGCGDREIESITGMSPAMVTRYSRFTDQRQLAKAAVLRLERRKDAQS